MITLRVVDEASVVRIAAAMCGAPKIPPGANVAALKAEMASLGRVPAGAIQALEGPTISLGDRARAAVARIPTNEKIAK